MSLKRERDVETFERRKRACSQTLHTNESRQSQSYSTKLSSCFWFNSWSSVNRNETPLTAPLGQNQRKNLRISSNVQKADDSKVSSCYFERCNERIISWWRISTLNMPFLEWKTYEQLVEFLLLENNKKSLEINTLENELCALEQRTSSQERHLSKGCSISKHLPWEGKESLPTFMWYCFLSEYMNFHIYAENFKASHVLRRYQMNNPPAIILKFYNFIYSRTSR